MRIPLLLATLLASASLGLAGCTQGDPGGDDFEATCPSWIKRMDSYHTNHGFFFNGTTFIGPHAEDGYPPPDAKGPPENFTLGASFFEFQDRPLDRISLTFAANQYKSGAIVKNGFVDGFVTDASGAPVPVSDHRKGVEQRQESIVLEDGTAGNFTIDVILSEPGQEPAPRGVRIDWYYTPDSDATEEDPSIAVFEFTANYWYRTC